MCVLASAPETFGWLRSRARPKSKRTTMGGPILAAVALVCGPTTARSEEAATEAVEQGRPTSSESSTTPPRPATIQSLAEDVAGQAGRLIAHHPRPRLDLAVSLRSALPREASRGDELAELLRQILLATLGRSQPLRSVAPLAEQGESTNGTALRALAARQGFELLLALDLLIEGNHLVVRGVLYETGQHLWRAVVEPEQRVVGQVFWRGRVNAEIRHYLGDARQAQLGRRSFPLARRSYLAMAVADLDGDDLEELVLLDRRALEIHRLSEGGLTLLARRSLHDLPLAVTRTRDPVGSLAIGPRGPSGSRPMALRTSDYSQGVILGFDGDEIRANGEVVDFPIRWQEELECASTRVGRSAFETAPTRCQSLAAAPSKAAYYNLREVVIESPRGPPGTVTAVAQADGRVGLRWNGERVASVSSFGTALAVTDVEDDGIAEVLLSSDAEPGEPDELTVIRLGPAGARSDRAGLGPIDGSVWVAAAGDVDGDGFRELLAISETATEALLLIVE